MTKKIIFQDSFLVSGIMCHQGCGLSIQNSLNNLEDIKKDGLIPKDAQLIIDAEPQTLGIHRLFILIESNDQQSNQNNINSKNLSEMLQEKIQDIGFEVINGDKAKQKNKVSYVNWLNILINCGAMFSILILSMAFPPSVWLTTGLFALSFISTGFTARSYLMNFAYNFPNKSLANMATPISLGWLLSCAHALYHSITMPMATGISMTFMNFIMPVLLITVINIMDEIKLLILNASKKMYLNSMNHLFPEMASEYSSYQLSPIKQKQLALLIEQSNHANVACQITQLVDAFLKEEQSITLAKNRIKQQAVITVKAGECFPVDGIIIQGNTLVDTSILTGESKQHKQLLDFIPAGAINISNNVIIYAKEDCYNSTVNKLLFIANRAEKEKVFSESHPLFNYMYTGLILAGITASIFAPLAWGIFSIPLVLQNIIGVLFAICPCTIAIAHQLPKLLSSYQRHKKGIILRNAYLTELSCDAETIVFDKTGTLTTGNSQVESSEGISMSLWQRVYLLEKAHGDDHPLAKAICKYYEANDGKQSIIHDVKGLSKDEKNRGLTAIVQGKPIHIGNSAFLKSANIDVPKELPSAIQAKLERGYTLLYVAENYLYQGIILVKHEIKKNILESLMRLKESGIKLIMLTGDSKIAAVGFNSQNGSVFDSNNIHAEQTPQDKEDFLKRLMADKNTNPKSIWFVGDGLNDAPCARIVSEKGGISFAMTSEDKSAFFSDISLDGSLKYLFTHNKLNQFIRKNTLQNQGIIAYGALAFLIFILTFSIVGIAVSPLIPMIIMALTTLFTLLNSYRVTLSVDTALDSKPSWIKQFLVSDTSFGLLLSATSLFVISLLISTVTSGCLTLPTIAFNAGIIASISSACVLIASAMTTAIPLLIILSCLRNKDINSTETAGVKKPCITIQSHKKQNYLQSNSEITKNTSRLDTNSPQIIEEKSELFEIKPSY